MGIIASIRPPVPVAETPTPTEVKARPGGMSPADVAAPVAQTLQAQALQQPAGAEATTGRHLMQARMSADTTAAAAAEAARDAYIKASIAAGLSPLPLP
jgi:hypothetical protein